MSLFASAAFWTQQSQGMFFSDPDKIGLSAIPTGLGGAGKILYSPTSMSLRDLYIIY